MTSPETATLQVACNGCKSELGAEFTNKFCPNCGYPVNDTPQEQKKFVGRLKVMRLELGEELKKINRVRICLFIIATIVFVSDLVSSANMPSGFVKSLTIALSALVSLIFVGLALLVRKYPLPVCVIGLSLYGFIILLNAFASENFFLALIGGILVKIFIFSSFIYGILAAKKSKQLKADLEQYINIKLS